MAVDAKGFFARQETTARESLQHLEKEHTMRAKTTPKYAAHKFRVGDPVWVLTPAYAHSPHQNLVNNRRGGPQDW